MKKKDLNDPDVRKRRKGTRNADSTSPSAAELSSSPQSNVKSTRSADGAQSHVKRAQRLSSSKDDSLKPSSLKDVSVLDIETIESQKYESTEEVHHYRRTCEEIKKMISEVEELKTGNEMPDEKLITERRIRSTLLTLSLKKLNRLALIKSKTAREKTQEMKQNVDILHLDLQNLLYEVMHMRKEIQKCTEFTSKDEEIDLVDVDAFYQEAPSEISKPEVTRSDKHDQMLARLEWELDQRKKLASMKNQLLKDKSFTEKKISSQTEILLSLKPSLAGILNATMPLQEQLHLKIDENKVQFEIAAFLPKPLYVLYVQANAYCEGKADELSVRIEGDEQAAKALLDKDTQKIDDYEDSEPEEWNDIGDKEDNKRRRHKEDKEKARLEEKRRSILRKHPLEIRAEVTCNESVIMSLTFAYLTSLDIVTVSTSLQIPKEIPFAAQCTGSLLSPQSILNDLFGEKDEGDDSPNISNEIALERLGLKSFPAYVAELGRPYCWAQRLSGLNYLPKSPRRNCVSNDSCQSQNIASVIKAMRDRVATRLLLLKQLIDLENFSVPVSQGATQLFPPNIETRLVEWKAITSSDFTETLQPNDWRSLVNDDDMFYFARFKRGQEELLATVSIGANYPWEPPIFVVKRNQSTELTNFTNEVERELNVNFMRLVEMENPDMLLTNQLRKLMVCFDVHCETGGECLRQDRFYIRKQRGRDRSRPYNYVQEKGIFVH